MKCKKCGSEWNTNRAISVCPFCGRDLDEGRDDHDIRGAFVQILESRGIEILAENNRFISLLADYAPQYAKERNLIKNALSVGVAKTFLDANGKTDAERQRAVLIVRRDLKDKLYIDDNGVNLVVACFTSALRWKTTHAADISASVQPPIQPNNIVAKPSPQPQAVVPQPVPSVKFSSHGASESVAEILHGRTQNLQFGDYMWFVLDVQNDKALLITEDIIEKRSYNDAWTGVTWETCGLRKYLNGKFLQKFTKEDQRKIVETQISNPDNLWYGTPGGWNTFDKVFLLSLEEVDRYFGNSGDYQNKRRKGYEHGKWVTTNNGWYLSNAHDGDRAAKFGNEACWWWLRSPGSIGSRAADVAGSGDVYIIGGDVIVASGGVRPALWLNLKF